MRVEKILSATFLVLSSIILGVAGLEIMLRVYLRFFADEDFVRKYASLKQLASMIGESAFSPHRYLGFYPTPNFERGMNKHNSLGFCGEEFEKQKPEGVFRIVCIGGSTTYTKVGSHRESYPFLLQANLQKKGYSQVEVINAGVKGYASWESLINFQLRVLELEPDLLIVYHGFNDIHCRFVWPPSAYRADNSGARVDNVKSFTMPPIWHYSTLLRIFLIRIGYATPPSLLSFAIERPSSFYADLHTKQYLQNRYPDGIFKEVSPFKMLEMNPPKYFESNLRCMTAIAAACNIKVVLATFATSPSFPGKPRVSSREYQQAMAEHNEVIRGLLDEAYIFDFAEAMPKDKKYFLDGRHFTKLGNEHRAKLFADYLDEHHLIK